MQSDAEARRRVFEGGKGETPRGAVVVHDHPAPGVTATLPPRPTPVWAVQPLLGRKRGPVTASSRRCASSQGGGNEG